VKSKAWLGLLLLVLVAGQGMAVREPKTKLMSACETMWFANGVSPDAGYAGCSFLGITELEAVTDAYGNCVPDGDSLVVVGKDADDYRFMALLSFDISALPDSAVITEAKLYLRVASTLGTASASVYSLGLSRMLAPFNSGASLANRRSSPDTAWAGTTGDPFDPLGGSAEIFGGASASMGGANDGYANVLGRVVNTLSGALNFGLADSVFDGRYISPPAECFLPTRSPTLKYHVLAVGAPCTEGWFSVDVTDAVRRWHTGAWANYGWAIQPTAFVVGNTITFRSACSIHPQVHPKLLVKYLYATTGLGRQRTVAGME
jgi:hypothetical protein